MNKKGAERKVTGGMIAILIVIVAFIVWFGVSGNLVKLTEKLGFGGTCKISSLVTTVGAKSEGVFPKVAPQCKTSRLKVTGSMLNDLKPLAGKANPRLSDQQQILWGAQHIVADAMADCVKRGWKGRLDFKGAAFDLDAEEQACFVCAVKYFDESAINMLGTTRLPMEVFLKSNFYEGKTYYDYITEEQPQLQKSLLRWNVDLSKPVAIAFAFSSVKKAGTLTGDAVGYAGWFDYGKLTTDLEKWVVVSSLGPVTTSRKQPYCAELFGE